MNVIKPIVIFGFIVFAAGLAACTKEDTSSLNRAGNLHRNQTVYLWIDPETRCEYLSNNLGNSSIIPRYDKFGKQICRSGEEGSP